jgi:hypothetical protein
MPMGRLFSGTSKAVPRTKLIFSTMKPEYLKTANRPMLIKMEEKGPILQVSGPGFFRLSCREKVDGGAEDQEYYPYWFTPGVKNKGSDDQKDVFCLTGWEDVIKRQGQGEEEEKEAEAGKNHWAILALSSSLKQGLAQPSPQLLPRGR